MKKPLMILLPLLAILMVVAIAASILILNYQPNSQSDPTTGVRTDLLSYVEERWQLSDAEYADGTLTVRKHFGITYEQACKLGGNIFADDLAPESYLSLVATLAADLDTQFETAPALVVLRYCSSDGKTIFSVDSNGEITLCWE